MNLTYRSIGSKVERLETRMVKGEAPCLFPQRGDSCLSSSMNKPTVHTRRNMILRRSKSVDHADVDPLELCSSCGAAWHIRMGRNLLARADEYASAPA